mmetsp:Transcript_146592/g.470317  ORF Transcript_146592/g.470317 Transcript_146592/m.470317 type:complete len:205 (-) Transcript_146592:2693-3307(-)
MLSLKGLRSIASIADLSRVCHADPTKLLSTTASSPVKTSNVRIKHRKMSPSAIPEAFPSSLTSFQSPPEAHDSARARASDDSAMGSMTPCRHCDSARRSRSLDNHATAAVNFTSGRDMSTTRSCDSERPPCETIAATKAASSAGERSNRPATSWPNGSGNNMVPSQIALAPRVMRADLAPNFVTVMRSASSSICRNPLSCRTPT